MMELIYDFFIFSLNLLFWYVVFSILFHFLLQRTERNAREMSAIADRINELVHRVRVEQHYDNYYWYDADSDSFLAQGPTTTELIEQLRNRYPKHVFLLEDKGAVLKLSAPTWKIEKLIQVDAG